MLTLIWPLEFEWLGKDRAQLLKIKLFEPDTLKAFIKYGPYPALS
jgi:hypothetical protein